MSRRTTVLAILCAGLGALSAHADVWTPAPPRAQLALWPGTPPSPAPAPAGDEAIAFGKKPVGGRPWTYVSGVSRPTITVYPPHGKNTGAAVVVLPGGGYEVVAIDLEGTEACEWLTGRGITCVLLKYRVPCRKVGPYRDCP